MRFFFILSCLLVWVLASPIIDSEDEFRLANSYLQQYGPEDNIFYLLRDHGSIKRGLGPRPLRFG